MMRILIGILFVFSLFLIFSVSISPEHFSYIGLFSLMIFPFLLLNAIVFFVLISARRKLAILPLIIVVIGWDFVGITFQLPKKAENEESQLSVMSYNIHMLSYAKGGENISESRENLMQWLKEDDSDIKCFQEFYQDFTTPSRNALKILGKEVGYNYSYQIVNGDPKKISFGMVIFSKYPIINEGRVFDTRRNNGVIFADIKVNRDTIRVYNAHLESMSIDSEALSNFDGIKEKYRVTLGKLKRGQLTRASQLEVLTDHMKNSPYVNILVGDFNDVPYSYTYFELRKKMNNAFEQAGRGFGFTYNKVLFFLRIDNIFHEKPLKATFFKTHREVDYSDHYPVSASFSWTQPLKKMVIPEETLE
jgi:endonuclease/exonuclease/phosphatase family metal-dependent hydrolase